MFTHTAVATLESPLVETQIYNIILLYYENIQFNLRPINKKIANSANKAIFILKQIYK